MDCREIELCIGEEYLLKHSSTYNPLSTTWVVENGIPEIINADSAIVSFAAPREYNLQLIVSNNNGTDTMFLEEKFIVHENRIPIDSLYLGNDSYSLSIPDNIDNILWSTGETDPIILINSSGWYSYEGLSEFDCPVSDSIYIDFTSGLQHISEDNCLVFPNPSIDYLTIQCSENKKYNIRIFNSGGSLIKEESLVNYSKTLLDQGLYFVQIIDNQGLIIGNHKIVITN